MIIASMGTVGINAFAGAGSAAKPASGSFGQILKTVESPGVAQQGEHAPLGSGLAGAARVDQAPTGQHSAARVLERVSAAQQRMEGILQLAQSGKSFTPAELISLQSQAYRASQELDLAGKVVEKATGGVKQVLQTQV